MLKFTKSKNYNPEIKFLHQKALLLNSQDDNSDESQVPIGRTEMRYQLKQSFSLYFETLLRVNCCGSPIDRAYSICHMSLFWFYR